MMRTLVILLLLLLTATAAAQDATPTTDPTYWRGKRKVGVVQKRKFPKTGALEVAPYVGLIPNDAFVLHVPLGARVTWHRSEHFAWELSGSGSLDVDTGLRDFLMDADAGVSATIRDRQRARADLGLVWSPIYGKLAWMNASVLYLDVFVSAGAGVVYTPPDPRPELYAGLGARLFLSRTLSLRVEWRQIGYLRGGDDGGVATPSELSVGLGVLIR